MEHAMAIGLTSLAVLTVLAVDAIRKCHHRQPARGAWLRVAVIADGRVLRSLYNAFLFRFATW